MVSSKYPNADLLPMQLGRATRSPATPRLLDQLGTARASATLADAAVVLIQPLDLSALPCTSSLGNKR